jgi:cysteine desulfurase
MAVKLPIYMDHHATTPVDPRVFEAMAPFFLEKFGNAASRNHVFGWEAEQAVEEARKQVAALIHASSKEIIFTSGATESNNLAIKGVAWRHRERGNHIVTCVTEHRAVLDTCRRLEQEGFRVSYLPVNESGQVDPDDVRRAIGDETILVTLMAANNEIGVLHPLAEVGRICHDRHDREVLFHCDATQAAGKVPFDVEKVQVDLASLSAHKMYGPKGVGALYVRRRDRRVELAPMLDGGGHERGLRSGTLPVPSIVGFGKACELAQREMPEEARRLAGLRDRLQEGILARLDEVRLNGHPKDRLPANLNLSFAYVEGESLLMGLNDVAVSSGSACTSASREPSYVLQALGVEEELVQASLRFGLGRFNTEEEVDYVVERVSSVVHQLRELSPLYEAERLGSSKVS